MLVTPILFDMSKLGVKTQCQKKEDIHAVTCFHTSIYLTSSVNPSKEIYPLIQYFSPLSKLSVNAMST